MSDNSALTLDSSILMSAISTSTNSVTAQKASTVEGTAPKTSVADTTKTKSTASQDSTNINTYAAKGSSNYKAAMDVNGNGAITNQEMSKYYAKVSNAYGDSVNSLQVNAVGNVATTAQAANAYSANGISYNTASKGTSFIETVA